MKKFIFITLAVLIAAGNSILFAQIVQKDIQAQLILKIIGLDRNISRFGDPIKVGVTSKSMLRAIKRFSKDPVKGKAVQPELMETLEEVGGYHVVYIDKNWAGNYKAACDIASGKKILMFAAEDDAVERGEAAIAFKTVFGKTKIVLNREVVRTQGSDFPAGFLQVTHVVGNL